MLVFRRFDRSQHFKIQCFQLNSASFLRQANVVKMFSDHMFILLTALTGALVNSFKLFQVGRDLYTSKIRPLN